MKKHLVLATAALALSAGGALAASNDDFRVTTGASLATLCSVEQGSANYTAAVHMCQGYISGVDQLHSAMTGAGGSPLYCIPARGGPSRDQAMASFVSWVKSDPSVGALPAVEAMVRWAAKNYPCK